MHLCYERKWNKGRSTLLLCSDLQNQKRVWLKPQWHNDLWYAPWQNTTCCPQAALQKSPPTVLESKTQDLKANKKILTSVFLHTHNSDGIVTKPTRQRWRAQIFTDDCGLWVTACEGMSWIRLQTLEVPEKSLTLRNQVEFKPRFVSVQTGIAPAWPLRWSQLNTPVLPLSPGWSDWTTVADATLHARVLFLRNITCSSTTTH